MRKIKALIQWWMLLDLKQHKHWCKIEPEGNNTGRCEHQIGCWFCTGLFCANVERKDCPTCSAMTDEQKWALSRQMAERRAAARLAKAGS